MNSQYISWYARIEKELFSFFMLFDDLCSLCYKKTIEQACGGSRKKRKFWCCCLIDNQVHGYWEQLNAIQTKFDRKWYSDLKEKKLNLGRSMPGEGPCPALGPKGCMLSHHRPLTCTTQLCEKMLYVLNELTILDVAHFSPLQIEDVIKLPIIGEELYGIKLKSKKVFEKDVREYLDSVSLLKNKLAKADSIAKKNAIKKSIILMEGL
jgi:hypothetical protein